MAKIGIIAVNQRKVRVLQPEALHFLAEHDDAPVRKQPVLPSHAVQSVGVTAPHSLM
jgi:hypothetical protein